MLYAILAFIIRRVYNIIVNIDDNVNILKRRL